MLDLTNSLPISSTLDILMLLKVEESEKELLEGASGLDNKTSL